MDGLTSVQRRLLHAFTVLFGSHGAVTRQAAQDGQSRQALYRDTAKVVQAVDGSQTQARLEQLETRVAEQAAQLEQLTTQTQSQQRVQITTEKQAEFATLAQAEGVSLPTARRLLAVVMGPTQAPSVATLGRHSAAAARRAGQLLKVLDTEARKQVKSAAADEIFLAKRRS
jgi:anion-transporting  ArsA/GET3 family ATPase